MQLVIAELVEQSANSCFIYMCIHIIIYLLTLASSESLSGKYWDREGSVLGTDPGQTLSVCVLLRLISSVFTQTTYAGALYTLLSAVR